jgi:hypothetical protein
VANTDWARGDAKLEQGRIWVEPLPMGSPGREVDGYMYYDPWARRGAIFRHLVRVTSERQALGFAQKWGPIGEPQPEPEGEPDSSSPQAATTGTSLETVDAGERADSYTFGGPGRYLPPRGRLTRWQPAWPQSVAAYLHQATALLGVSRAIVALRLGRPVPLRQLRDAIQHSGLVPHALQRTPDMPSRTTPELERALGPADLINAYFRWAGTESRSFLIVDDAGELSLAHEYRCLVAPAALGLLEKAGLGRLRPCHYPECPVLSTLNHCGKVHERSCPLKAEHRVRASAVGLVRSNLRRPRQ